MSKHLLILDGGFAGLWSALAAAREAEIAGGGIAISSSRATIIDL